MFVSEKSIAEYSVSQSFIYHQVVCIVEVMIATNQPDLKEIERRAYTSYHQDGLLDIFAGVYILGFGMGILMDVLWDFGMGVIIIPAILLATVLPLWIAAKRKITMPRIGFVKFGPQSTNKLMAMLIGLAVTGLGVFLAFTLFQGGQSPWLDIVFQNGLLIIGFGSLAVCLLFGYSMGLKRLYAYGLLALIVLAIGHFMEIFFAFLLVALGITVIVTGCALLITFVRKYPLQGEKAIAD